MRRTLLLPLLIMIAASSAAWAGSHAQPAEPAADARRAGVAGGQTVALAPSARTAEQWAQKRPAYRALIPAKR
jgi:hypothetical protein